MINANRTIGEIAGRQPSTIEMFEQLGIQYCCHEEDTVEATCKYLGLPVKGVLSELNRVADANSTTKAPWAGPILEALMGKLLLTRPSKCAPSAPAKFRRRCLTISRR